MPKAYELDWKAMIEEQQASGLNMKAFCRKRELPYHSFKNHKYAMKNTSSSAFLFVRQEKNKDLQVMINGNVICFDAHMDDSDISRVLKALMR